MAPQQQKGHAYRTSDYGRRQELVRSAAAAASSALLSLFHTHTFVSQTSALRRHSRPYQSLSNIYILCFLTIISSCSNAGGRADDATTDACPGSPTANLVAVPCRHLLVPAVSAPEGDRAELNAPLYVLMFMLPPQLIDPTLSL